ncbi:carbohydrate ABC transporter permease [Paenibacillus sp. IB182496]|uniref:Carbohydrate ABC transporter permease n=1 Tax=Paenibacillus sabuli TaxID=2772509 RepID=A0A927GRJ2_9BACL|nr:carbohydrate ABC transporter permease [Paenibacillus sabuli]MBD2845553.1 carbohydrate ABC transporter permease [Paenibacillus sabuli]
MIRSSLWSRAFDGVNVALLLMFSLGTVLPFIHVIASSFASERLVAETDFLLFPTEFSLKAYQYIFSSDALPRSMGVSVFVTVAGTALNLFMTSLMAYSLSRRTIRFRAPIMFLVVFTMIFQGGLIPDYLVVKELGLLDSYWALMLPRAILPFYLIILINFFKQLPDGLEESARIDGCGDLRLLFRIVLPLSLPALATLTLFYAVMHWNTYMHAILYINDMDKWPIQVLLRQIVLISQAGFVEQGSVEGEASIPPDTVRMAVITVATFPILLVYPFLQKYFASGILLGSVKG